MHDEEAMYPYFANPTHIRSMRSLHGDTSENDESVTSPKNKWMTPSQPTYNHLHSGD